MTNTTSLLNKARKDRLTELANFLRNRRERIKPELYGIPISARRRTPGLRREELAQLAGVSVSWYTWLEQGRSITVSDQVLESIARILQLDFTERRHLFQLARNQSSTPIPIKKNITQSIISELQPVLDSFGLCPAYIVDQCWNLVVGNQIAYKIFVDTSVVSYADLPWRERNLMWALFTNPYQKKLLLDWENEAKRCIALFRFSSNQYIGEPWFTEFIDDLTYISPHFQEWWPQYDIQSPYGKLKTLNHPIVGRLVLQATTLLIPEFPELQLIVYTPLLEEDTTGKLAKLANL
jgi:transcriptional regulator with XRE-family HTH domain